MEIEKDEVNSKKKDSINEDNCYSCLVNSLFGIIEFLADRKNCRILGAEGGDDMIEPLLEVLYKNIFQSEVKQTKIHEAIASLLLVHVEQGKLSKVLDYVIKIIEQIKKCFTKGAAAER